MDGSSTRRRGEVFPALAVPSFVQFFASGIFWYWARWGFGFLTAFHVNEVTDSARLVQLTGTALWTPMLVGGVMGGVLADRYNRVKIVRVQLMAMVPVAGLLGVLELVDRLEVWMIYPMSILTGLAWVTDMTSRRSLIVDIVGPERLNNAVALESTLQASGMVIGSLLGGVVIAALGVGEAFLVLCGFFVLAAILFFPLQTSYGEITRTKTSRPLKELRQGFALLRTNQDLRSILGVTVTANMCYFVYLPAVQRIGDRLDASPDEVGLLASMTGLGMMTGALLMAVSRPRRVGAFYVAGPLFAMVTLVAFARAGSLPMAIAALFIASVGTGLFGSTQSALVLSVTNSAVRGRAMGLLGMSIGALPVGSLVLGELAERWGVRTAIVTMTLIGFVALVLWVTTHRQVLFITATGSRSPGTVAQTGI